MFVSIIIPIFNTQNEIKGCLESVLGQTLRDIEVICINDGSTDDSLRIINEYAQKDSRIKVFSQSNIGAGPTRNRGIAVASGKYVAFMDADDMYPSDNVLELMYEKAEESGCNVCGGEWKEFLPDGTIISDFSGEYSGYIYAKEGITRYKDYQYDYGYHRFIYKRSFLLDNGLMFPGYLRYQDPPFMIKTMTVAKEFYALKTPTYLYREGNKQIEWNTERVCDLVQGMAESLHYANDYDYFRIKYLIYKRITVNYKKQILAVLNSQDRDILIPLLKTVGNLVDFYTLKKFYKLSDENKIFAMIDEACYNPKNKKIKRWLLYLKRNGIKRTIRKFNERFSKDKD